VFGFAHVMSPVSGQILKAAYISKSL